MTQFAIHQLRTGNELVCRIQTDFGIPTAYLLCAPVVRREDWGPPIPRLHIPIDINTTHHLILMTQLIALPSSDLGATLAHAITQRDAIILAIDLIVTGF